MAELPFCIEKLPFYYQILKQPYNMPGIPDFEKMTLNFNHDTGVLYQEVEEGELELLEKAYENGSNISGLMEESGIGKEYADDFIKYLKKNITDFRNLNILEIGCGTGYLLYELKKLGGGVNVIGIEPGPYARVGKEKYNITIINDFFSRSYFQEEFDVVIAYAVLEHIQDSAAFLKDIEAILSKTGSLFLSVPDCTEYIEKGDISCLLHEHWNYFTKQTLQNTVAMYTNLGVDMEESSFAGALYAKASYSAVTEVNPIDQERKKVLDFVDKIKYYQDKLQNLLGKCKKEKKVLGIYVPGRVINILSSCNFENSIWEMIRFFDDNKHLYHSYYPGIDVKVENFEDFVQAPTDIMLIMSKTFGDKIADKIEKQNTGCTIIKWEQFFNLN